MSLFDTAAWQFRQAGRSLLRRPALMIVGIATLALGIGANTAVFSIIDTVLLEPLPFARPDRLVMTWSTAPSQGLKEGAVSYADFKDWHDQSAAFEALAAFWTFPNGDINLGGGSEPQRVSVARITPGFFEALGVTPLLGRPFQPEETIVGNHRRVILSYPLWRDQFGADPLVVGRTVTVNEVPYTVVGVMPRSLSARSVHVLGTDVQLWRPLVPEDNQTGGRGHRVLKVIGRLRAGVSLPQAEADLSAIASRLSAAFPETNRESGVRLVPLREQVVGDVRRGLVFLLAAVAVVLVGACANVTNLLLIKAAGARRQIAVQHALGAAPARIAGQVLTESLLLGAAGALLGVLLAYWGVRAFVAIGPAEVPLLADARLNGTVLAFALGATLLTVLLVGGLPAWRSSRRDVAPMLRQSATTAGRGDERRLMRGLSVAQFALAMAMLTTGGLLLRSFRALLAVDPGFQPRGVLSFQLELPMAVTAAYPKQEMRTVFFETLMERVRTLPGVRDVALANAPPLDDDPLSFAFTLPNDADRREFRVNLRLVTGEYFPLLGVPLLRGRLFDATDRRDGPRVVLVSDALARAAWPGENPVGRRIATSSGEQAEVIGVVGNVRTGGLDADPGRTVYVPTSQWTYNFMTILLKTAGHQPRLVATLREAVHVLDPSLPLHHVRTLDALLSASVAQQRFHMLLVTTFSVVMFLLAAVGTYGVTAYGVSERTGELGIRAALGATREELRRLVLREGLRLVMLGILLGAGLTAAMSQMLRRFVTQVSPLDPLTFLVASLVLGLAALLATLIPAHRASRADPMAVLRAE